MTTRFILKQLDYWLSISMRDSKYVDAGCGKYHMILFLIILFYLITHKSQKEGEFK